MTHDQASSSHTLQLPALALSVHQPWAWAIIHAGRDIDDRPIRAIRHLSPLKGRRAIHAAKSMTQAEYRIGRAFMAALGIECPPASDLQRGGIIGTVEVCDVVKSSASRWWRGPRGLVLRDPKPCEFVAAIGERGYFEWRSSEAGEQPAARWMNDPGIAQLDMVEMINATEAVSR